MATEIATLGGGCFWCVEAAFTRLNGVISVKSGYADGDIENPSYEQVCLGTSGHAEVIQIKYNPDIISYNSLLDVFFSVHDSTTLNRQGNDIGTQYRSIILYHNDYQKKVAQTFISELNGSGKLTNKIVTEVKPFSILYDAEENHQQFFDNNPNNRYCQIVIPPKLEKLKKYHDSLLKK